MERENGRLVLVGLGLDDERGITLKGLDETKAAETVFAEFYTSALRQGSIERLERIVGKRIQVLGRKQVEDGKDLLEACKRGTVVLLVAGDPMTATTHVDLRLRAHMVGISTSVVNGASVFTSAAGLLGLQHYKFGRTTTLPFSQEGFSPTSPYDVLCENLSRGLHTLLLLDIDADGGRYMTANEGLRSLADMESRVGKGVVKDDLLVCVVSRAGSDDCVVMAGDLVKLCAVDFGPPLHTIVVPGRLHFMEEEALREFAGLGR